MREAIKMAFRQIEHAFETADNHRIIRTQFIGVNFTPGQLVVIKGTLSTEFALNIALQIADTESVTLLTKDECDHIAMKFISAKSNLTLQKLHTGSLEHDDWCSLANTCNNLNDVNIEICHAESFPRAVRTLDKDMADVIIMDSSIPLIREDYKILKTIARNHHVGIIVATEGSDTGSGADMDIRLSRNEDALIVPSFDKDGLLIKECVSIRISDGMNTHESILTYYPEIALFRDGVCQS